MVSYVVAREVAYKLLDALAANDVERALQVEELIERGTIPTYHEYRVGYDPVAETVTPVCDHCGAPVKSDHGVRDGNRDLEWWTHLNDHPYCEGVPIVAGEGMARARVNGSRKVTDYEIATALAATEPDAGLVCDHCGAPVVVVLNMYKHLDPNDGYAHTWYSCNMARPEYTGGTSCAVGGEVYVRTTSAAT